MLIKITEALMLEHVVLNAMFDQIESLLPGLASMAEVKLLANLVEKVLANHSKIENDLAYSALDHILEQDGQLDQLYQDHQEIDARLIRVRTASEPVAARRLLQEAIAASRDHFKYEERTVFPFIEEVMQGETLEELGKAWHRQSFTQSPALPKWQTASVP